MTTILIVVIVGISQTGFTAEFNTPQACAAAAAQVEERVHNVVTMCVPKGTVPTPPPPAAKPGALRQRVPV